MLGYPCTAKLSFCKETLTGYMSSKAQRVVMEVGGESKSTREFLKWKVEDNVKQ